MGTVFPHQEMSVETLLRNSDLSPELLHQALLPLTSDKGPLTLEGAQNLPQGGKLAGSVLKLCGMVGGPEGGGDYTREGKHGRILIHVSPPVLGYLIGTGFQGCCGFVSLGPRPMKRSCG